MFTGKLTHSLDEKGRIRIPARFRDKLGAEPFITYGDGCLLIMPKDYADKKFNDHFKDSDFTDLEKAPLMRYLLRGVTAEEDKQGRILLPADMIDFGGFTKELVTLGMWNYLELWDEERLKEKESGMTYASVVSKLSSLSKESAKKDNENDGD